jgi:hypothetical protein
MRIVQIEVIVIHPSLLVLQMGTVVVLAADRNQDASRFPRLDDRHHLVRLGTAKIMVQKSVSPALVTVAVGSLQKRNAPFLEGFFTQY